MPRIIKPATGAFTTASVSIDSSGRVYSASSGAAAAAGYIPTFLVSNDGSGNHVVSNNTSKINVYVRGGGGGGGGSFPAPSGGGAPGGGGGFGFWNHPVTSGETLAYTVGAGGNGGSLSYNSGTRNGNAGSATTIDSNLTGNGGSAGGPGSGGHQPAGSPGGYGDAPGADLDMSTAGGYYAFPGGAQANSEGMAGGPGSGGDFSARASGQGGKGWPGSQAGTDGSIVIWENIG